MNRTIIYFVRHAHSLYSQDEAGRPLSEKGMTDCEHITSMLKNAAIDKVQVLIKELFKQLKGLLRITS